MIAGAQPGVVRVTLPSHLRALAGVDGEVRVEVAPPVTQRAVLDALEAAHPVLAGSIRDRATGARRALVRFFADERDVSHEPPDAALPEAVASGRQPLHVIGAIAGG